MSNQTSNGNQFKFQLEKIKFITTMSISYKSTYLEKEKKRIVKVISTKLYLFLQNNHHLRVVHGVLSF